MVCRTIYGGQTWLVRGRAETGKSTQRTEGRGLLLGTSLHYHPVGTYTGLSHRDKTNQHSQDLRNVIVHPNMYIDVYRTCYITMRVKRTTVPGIERYQRGRENVVACSSRCSSSSPE